MRLLLTTTLFLCSYFIPFAQKTRVPPRNYPSLLWEITGKDMSRPSYLFGTMHVSSKMVFHLSDSFYLGIKNADVVALETDMGTWQEDFSRYDLDAQGIYNYLNRKQGSPTDFLNMNSLQAPPYEKLIEVALYNSPSMINNFLYRSYSEKSSDFEEDTYLDLHIYQTGKKWGKKVCGVESFDRSMQLMKEAYMDAAKEKNKKERSFDYDGDFSYAKLEDAYRTGNLDLLDTINKINSASAAFDEKFLYTRNQIQARSIDSIIKTKASLFVGVGAAHLPGQRGVIELLRKMGYHLRPIKMTERDSRHKDEVEKIRVPVQFSTQTSADGFFSVSMPGKLYDFETMGLVQQQQFADMSNGSYYMITRINTNTILWGHSEETVLRKIDSVIYENIPGKILSRQTITRNGYKGIEINNRTRRGDYQRYNIFVTPFEILLFKMSGNGEYVKEGKEADQFFNSIQLRAYTNQWQSWSPSFGGFRVDVPHVPVIAHPGGWLFQAYDPETGTGYEVIRTDIHNYDFVEEDSFDLNLLEESFGNSDFIDRQISRKQTRSGGYPALDAKYKYKDGSTALVRFLIQGPHYYTLVAHGHSEKPGMNRFLNSFTLQPFIYGSPVKQTDTSLYFTVNSPVPLERTHKLSLYPENMNMGNMDDDDESFFEENATYKDKLISSDSTGEKIYVSFFKPSRYYYDSDTATAVDTVHFKTDKLDWTYRSRHKYELPNKTSVFEYVLGEPRSSRYVRGKLFTREGISVRLETEGDTLSKPSSFITGFFSSFQPSDTVKSINPSEKKSNLFFSDFFSNDTLMHKRAVKNINRLDFDSSDFSQLKKAIESLNWNEKKYMDVKKDFVWQLSNVRSEQSASYLKDIYYAAGDTVDLQYMAIEALLNQKTSYAYKLFRDIMVTDPPILNLGGQQSTFRSKIRLSSYFSANDIYNGFSVNNRNNNFFDDLTDSLQLTAEIFKDILPLINIHDYEQPVMDLMGVLVDSAMIAAHDYEPYQTKFLIEAKQLMKKQIIEEKNKSIEKAQQDEDDKKNMSDNEDDDGNSQLSLYATLLMPFWDKNPGVPQLVNQMLSSNDKRLKFNTTLLLIRHQHSIPDTLLPYFAAMDDYRYDLYTSLKQIKKTSLFPVAYNKPVELAKSKLLGLTNNYNKPDSIAYIDKLPIRQNERNGYVYFFKFKQKKDDNSWKLATVGIVSQDPSKFEYDALPRYAEEKKYNYTDISGTRIEPDEPLKEQMKKMLKKMQYSKRNSANEFYREDHSTMDLMSEMNIRE